VSEGVEEGITIYVVNYPRIWRSGAQSIDMRGALNFSTLSIKEEQKKEGDR
jgi:hypothetical protein